MPPALAPVALSLVLAGQRAREIRGALIELLVQAHELTHLLGQRRAVLAFGDISRFDLALKLLQTRLQWLQQLAQGRLVLLAEALRFLFQNFLRQYLELLRELTTGILQQCQLFAGLLALALQLTRQARQPLASFSQCGTQAVELGSLADLALLLTLQLFAKAEHTLLPSRQIRLRFGANTRFGGNHIGLLPT